MKNLETVVRERNRAYYLLETGEDGERPYEMRENDIALQEYYGYVDGELHKHINHNSKLFSYLF